MTGSQSDLDQLREILDAASDGVAQLDRSWKIQFLNRTAQAMLAGSGELISRNHWDAFPAADFDGSPWLLHYYAAMDRGVSGAFDHFYPEPLNIWMHISVMPVSTGIVIFFRDTTEQHRAADALRASDERLRLALTAAEGVGVWDWDIPNDLVYADAHFAQLYGVAPELASSGMPIQEFMRAMHPDDRESVGAHITAAIASGQEFCAEYRLVQTDGSINWVCAVGSCSYSPEGKPLRFPGVSIDITRRKRTEATLRESEARMRIAAETAGLGSWQIDLATGLMECSTICKANFGRSPHQPFLYADLIASIYEEDRPSMEEQVREALETGKLYRAEYRVIWPDGSLHWILASGRTIADDHQPVSHMVGITLDVTERHLAAETLLQTEKLAAVGRLASSIAHEINNPLESVTNLLYLSRQSTNPTEIQGYLDLAERELHRVSVISNQTLRFHKQSTRPRSVAWQELIDGILSMHHGRLVNSHVAVEQRDRAATPIICFEGEIRQVLNNIIGNAIDALHPDGGRLLLRCRRATDWTTGRLGLVFTLADTGPGIPPEFLSRIFEAFFTTKGIGGTGLGLWVSQEIVDRHEGKLRLRSRQAPGHHGTVFTLFLPLKPAMRSSTTL